MYTHHLNILSFWLHTVHDNFTATQNQNRRSSFPGKSASMNCDDLTHICVNKSTDILQTTFISSVFLESSCILFQISLRLLNLQYTISAAGNDQAASHYLNKWGPSWPMHTCVTRTQRVKSINGVTILSMGQRCCTTKYLVTQRDGLSGLHNAIRCCYFRHITITCIRYGSHLLEDI